MNNECKIINKQTNLFIEEFSSCSYITEEIALSNDWQIQTLSSEDLQDVIEICNKSFPLEYPDYWYKEVVDGKFISFGFFHCKKLTSLLIAEIKLVSECDFEDRELFKSIDKYSRVVYILSLAVRDEYKRRGIASRLLDHLIKILSKQKHLPIFIFLHVLARNFAAINFYKRNGFYHFTTLKNYYQIENIYHDGFTMVCYLDKNFIEHKYGLYSPVWWSPKQLCNLFSAIFSTPFRLLIRFKPSFIRL